MELGAEMLEALKGTRKHPAPSILSWRKAQLCRRGAGETLSCEAKVEYGRTKSRAKFSDLHGIGVGRELQGKIGFRGHDFRYAPSDATGEGRR